MARKAALELKQNAHRAALNQPHLACDRNAGLNSKFPKVQAFILSRMGRLLSLRHTGTPAIPPMGCSVS